MLRIFETSFMEKNQYAAEIDKRIIHMFAVHLLHVAIEKSNVQLHIMNSTSNHGIYTAHLLCPSLAHTVRPAHLSPFIHSFPSQL